jgi:hypothetical protein
MSISRHDLHNMAEQHKAEMAELRDALAELQMGLQQLEQLNAAERRSNWRDRACSISGLRPRERLARSRSHD